MLGHALARISIPRQRCVAAAARRRWPYAVFFFARGGVMLADEVALKDMLDCKGHAGTKPCVACKNIVGLRSDFEGANAISIACIDVGRFQLHTDGSIRQALHRLRTGQAEMTRESFALLERMLRSTALIVSYKVNISP